MVKTLKEEEKFVVRLFSLLICKFQSDSFVDCKLHVVNELELNVNVGY